MSLSDRNYQTGTPLTVEAIHPISDQKVEQDLIQMYQSYQVEALPDQHLGRIQAWSIQHAAYPVFQKFYYEVLLASGKRDQAQLALINLRRRFPDYLFGITHEAIALMVNEAPESDILALLGERLHLPDLMPEREIFHTSEFLAYQEACTMFQFLHGADEDAQRRLEVMLEVDPDDPASLRTKAILLPDVPPMASAEEV